MIQLSPTFNSKILTLLRALAVLAVGLVIGCQSTMQVRHQNALEAESFRTYRIVEHPVGRTGAVDDIIENVIHR
ncbi:MAG: hypothetical protein AMJ63_04830, partial [Myxococcales bacterium SG8_38_1]